MKKGRAVVENVKEDDIQKKKDKKYIDIKAIQFPEFNPIDLKVKSGDIEYKLANYRYPSQTKDKKGIIFYLHGFGEHCGNYGYFAKYFADQGYDFFGLDQRGFGRSEGPRAHIESEE